MPDDEVSREHALTLAGRFPAALATIDQAVGVRWRPPYGDLVAGAGSTGRKTDRLAAAHADYQDALFIFARRPALLTDLPPLQRARLQAAVEDARERFGRDAVTLGYLIEVIATAHPEERRSGTGSTPPPQQAPLRARTPTKTPPPTRAFLPAEPNATNAISRPRAVQRSGRALALAVGGGSALALLVLIILGLRLTGGGGTTGQAAPPVIPATLPPGLSAAGTAPDVTALQHACPSFPSGKTVAAQTVTATASGIAPNPLSGLPTPEVTVSLAGPPSPGIPLSLTIVVLPFSASPAAVASGVAADQAGTAQLIAYWDGRSWHRGLRVWSGTAWNTSVDIAANGLDLATTGATVTLFWEGLPTGARFGELIASSAGCASHDMDAMLTPQQQFGG